MARIAGVNIPVNKKVEISLRSIFGIGPKRASLLCKEAKVDPTKKVYHLTEDEVISIRSLIDSSFLVEGDLRREIGLNIKNLMDIKCYRGLRHMRRLPVRGQRTHTNARTRKGRAVAIAGKKKVTK